MVDFQTYRQLHGDGDAFKREYKSIGDSKLVRIGSSVVDADDPPPIPEIYAFPDQMVAYNLRTKSWGKSRCVMKAIW